jgi:F0F1-type ATP synthase membrane subunit c/vacuolar-type H+-ATPase subunit K
MIAMRIGLFAGAVSCTPVQGLALMAVGICMGIVEWRSAIYQGEASAAGIAMTAKKPEESGRAILLPALVETYAVLALVSGQVEVGGLVGDNFYGSVTGCFWDLNTSSQLWSAGGEGKTTDEMKTKSTFTDVGWDFVNIWDICDGTNYPRLQWQTLPAADWSCPDGVGLEDFSYLADGWQMEFGINDLMMLCEQWLEGR